jgi:hypothetical protein
MHLSKAAKESVLVMSLALFLSAVAWLLAVSHLAMAFLGGHVGNFVGDACFYLSVPGWLLAVLLFGYDQPNPLPSLRTRFYTGVVVILILRAARFFASRSDVR